jgi:hypothetical protein
MAGQQKREMMGKRIKKNMKVDEVDRLGDLCKLGITAG